MTALDVQERILEQTGGRVRGLRVGTLNDRIVVSGTVPTHELQQAVMAAIREAVRDFLIMGRRAVAVCMNVEICAIGPDAFETRPSCQNA